MLDGLREERERLADAQAKNETIGPDSCKARAPQVADRSLAISRRARRALDEPDI